MKNNNIQNYPMIHGEKYPDIMGEHNYDDPTQRAEITEDRVLRIPIRVIKLNWWGIDRYALQAIEDEKGRILRDPIRTEALRGIRYGEEGENKFIVVGDNPLKELSFGGGENLIYGLYGRDGINCLNQIDVGNENTNIGMILVTGTNIGKMGKHPSWGIVKPRLVSTPQEIIRLNVYAIKAEEIGHSTRNHIRMQRKGLTSYYDRRRVSGESIRLPIQTALYPNCITGRIKV